MCAICGIFDFSGEAVDQSVLSRMTNSMSHRGPDGAGEYLHLNAGLGHRRLSIIDVQGGGQPIGNEDGTIQVVFNGEIYNFIELTKELNHLGHTFQTQSDTEVIVHAYEQWGINCVQRFNGMFAFALLDTRKHQLFIARDHLGIKPLYYTTIGNQFLFASEIKSILQHPKCPREVNTRSLLELFTFRYVPSPHTLLQGIYKLLPGHAMVISREGINIERYWNRFPRLRKSTNLKDAIEEYQNLLEHSIRLQMRSDVPIGLFLSSGVDSGLLLAIMSNYSHHPVRTFTVGFEAGEKSNEVNDASHLAQMFQAEHNHMMITADDYMAYYERYMWDLEEPVGNETAAAFYFVSKITSGQVKVALTGQGADEPWAGYHRHLGAKLSFFYNKLPTFATKRMAPAFSALFPRNERLKRGVASLHERDPLERLVRIYSFFSLEMKSRLFNDCMKDEFTAYQRSGKNALRRLYNDVEDCDALTQMLYIDTRSNLPDDLLMVADKVSMANSLETRVPFLDYRLIEFIETLPPNLKIRGLQQKYLHKKASEKWLPKRIVYRKKKGFENPIDQWLRTKMRNFVLEMLLSPDSSVKLFFEESYIQAIVRDHLENHAPLTRHIYLLLSFELWHRRFIRV